MAQRILLASILLALSGPTWSSDLEHIRQLIASGASEHALTQLDTRRNTPAEEPQSLFLRAIALGQLQRRQEAIEIYQTLIERHPTLPEPHNNLAVLYAQQGDFQASERALQTALDTDASYATAHRNLSDIYKTLASIAYNKALNLDNGRQAALPETRLRLIEELRSYPGSGASAEVIPAVTPTNGGVPGAQPPAQQDAASAEETRQPVDTGKIKAALADWAAAWSAQDIEGYLGHYSADFVPENGLSREAWKAQRRQRLEAPDFIRVETSDTELLILANRVVSAIFTQRYDSDRFSELSRKLVLLKQEDGQWRIVQETEIK